MIIDSTSLPCGQGGDFIRDFDLESLRLPQDYSGTYEVKKQLTIVPIRKPPKDRFFRVHEDPAWQFQTMVLELKTDGELYLLGPDVRDIAPGLTRPMVLCAAIDQGGNPFLIPVPLPGSDGRTASARIFRVYPPTPAHYHATCDEYGRTNITRRPTLAQPSRLTRCRQR
jgi:hypothetical protein